MFNKLAGHTPLADMISQIIDDSRSKIAAAEGGDEKKPNPFFAKKDGDKKDEKKDDKGEKKASATIDYTDSEEVEKLASALESVGDELIKTADKQEKGGESPVGGTSLPVMSPVGGKQPYKKDGSSHETPNNTGLQSGGPGVKAVTQTPSDAKMTAKPNYPKKGVMKTAAEAVLAKMKAEAEGAVVEEEQAEEPVQEEAEVEATPSAEKPKAASVVALEAAVEKMAESGEEYEKRIAKGHGRLGAVMSVVPGALNGAIQGGMSGGSNGARAAKAVGGAVAGGGAGAALGYGLGRLNHAAAKKVAPKEKKSSDETSPVDYILDKMAGSLEKKMGGETLDSKSGDGPKPPSNPGREMIASNTAPVAATKAKAKAPQKKLMSQVLTEPMQSKANDSKVSENLRNASKGGVKIAAARELLKKVAAEGCTCDGKGECRNCKMKKSMEKESMGASSMGSGSMSSSPMA